MTLLQPSGVPSMDGINDAITSEDAEHVAADHGDTGWLTLPGTPHAALNITAQYRVRMGMVQVRFAGTLAANIAVGADGNMSEHNIGALPAGARPGGGGMTVSSVLPVEINQQAAFALIYNGGSVNLSFATKMTGGYTFTSGSAIQCNSPLLTVNS